MRKDITAIIRILKKEVNPVRELRSFTPLDNVKSYLTGRAVCATVALNHRLKSVAFSNGVKKMKTPAVGIVAEETRDPYRILISCLLSLRTKDDTTGFASRRLFQCATTPDEMLVLKKLQIEKLIYPVGFYKTKAKRILEISDALIKNFNGRVPDRMDDLLTLKGVGRKTANLVLTLGFDQDGICVDIHVHRISNRLSWVKTKHPNETELSLMKFLPKKHWKIINDLLVAFGQNICRPVSPQCSVCPINNYCPRIGVIKHR